MIYKGDFLVEDKIIFGYRGVASELHIPEGYVAVAVAAFYDCSFKKLYLPKTIEIIDEFAFAENQDLEEVYIHKSCRYIAESAFDSCNNIKYYIVEKGNEYFSSEDGVLLKASGIFRYPAGRKESHYCVPENITTIYGKAFNRVRGVSQLEIGSNVTSIGTKAFSFANGLGKVVLHKKLLHIAPNAFSNSDVNEFIQGGNKRFEVIDGMLVEGNTVLQYPCEADASDVLIPSRISSIEAKAFNGCRHIKNFIPTVNFAVRDGVLYSADGTKLLAFPGGKKLSTLVINDGIKNICEGAFQNVFIDNIAISDSVERIGKHAFAGCAAKEISFGKNLKTIEWSAFANCLQIKTLDFGVTKLEIIEGTAFFQCRNLREVIFPETIRYVDRWVFNRCPSLKRILINGAGNAFSSGIECGLSVSSVANMKRRINQISTNLL